MAAAYDVGNLRRGESTSLAASAAAAKERGAATSTRLAAARRNILIMMHSSSSLGELAVLCTHVGMALYRISQSIVTDGQRRS
jgi:hypothetical protein